MKKHFAKSKTNWGGVAIIAASLGSEEIRSLVCEHREYATAAVALFMMVLRNWKSDLRMKKAS